MIYLPPLTSLSNIRLITGTTTSHSRKTIHSPTKQTARAAKRRGPVFAIVAVVVPLNSLLLEEPTRVSFTLNLSSRKCWRTTRYTVAFTPMAPHSSSSSSSRNRFRFCNILGDFFFSYFAAIRFVWRSCGVSFM